jgi:DNA mismatch repair protein MSH6
MAQLGMFVPATNARYIFLSTTYDSELNSGSFRLSPVDTIITRMGAYDNMFSNASTFKVELDEWLVHCPGRNQD